MLSLRWAACWIADGWLGVARPDTGVTERELKLGGIGGTSGAWLRSDDGGRLVELTDWRGVAPNPPSDLRGREGVAPPMDGRGRALGVAMAAAFSGERDRRGARDGRADLEGDVLEPARRSGAEPALARAVAAAEGVDGSNVDGLGRTLARGMKRPQLSGHAKYCSLLKRM